MREIITRVPKKLDPFNMSIGLKTPSSAIVQEMRVNHRGSHSFVSEQLSVARRLA
jgi:hypothetical protein